MTSKSHRTGNTYGSLLIHFDQMEKSTERESLGQTPFSYEVVFVLLLRELRKEKRFANSENIYRPLRPFVLEFKHPQVPCSRAAAQHFFTLLPAAERQKCLML
jgi:hypothetical protein